MCSRWRGSMPLNGSSSSRIGGSWTRAPASLARWRMPLEYVPMGRSGGLGQVDRGDRPVGGRVRIGQALQPRVERANSRPVRNAVDRLALRHEPDVRGTRSGRRQAGRARDADRARGRRAEARPSCAAASTCRRRSGPSRPVTPAPERERDVVDGHHVAVPARDVVELDGGDARRAIGRGRRRPAGRRRRGRRRTGARRPSVSAIRTAQTSRRRRRCSRRPPRRTPSPAGRRAATTVESGRAEDRGVGAVEDVRGAEQDERPAAVAGRELGDHATTIGGHDEDSAMIAGRRIRAAWRQRGDHRQRQPASSPATQRLERGPREPRQLVGERRSTGRSRRRTAPRNRHDLRQQPTTRKTADDQRQQLGQRVVGAGQRAREVQRQRRRSAGRGRTAPGPGRPRTA